MKLSESLDVPRMATCCRMALSRRTHGGLIAFTGSSIILSSSSGILNSFLVGTRPVLVKDGCSKMTKIAHPVRTEPFGLWGI